MWRAETDSEADRVKCCCNAAHAALLMAEKMRNFTAQGVTLTLHSGLACGEVREMHLGGYKDRWEYMIAGRPITELGYALEASKAVSSFSPCFSSTCA